MEEFKIEKNVPVPEHASKWSRLAARMEVGDSVRLENGSQASGLMGAIKRQKFQGVVRCLVENAKGAERAKSPHRVWKVEPKKESK